ncbi:MAG: hypothetical protein JST73_04655 [Actinobacteria bacterium]|nr:hypothetical protein [Actinomycetota bacterium]
MKRLTDPNASRCTNLRRGHHCFDPECTRSFGTDPDALDVIAERGSLSIWELGRVIGTRCGYRSHWATDAPPEPARRALAGVFEVLGVTGAQAQKRGITLEHTEGYGDDTLFATVAVDAIRAAGYVLVPIETVVGDATGSPR